MKKRIKGIKARKCTEYKQDPIQRITIKGNEYEINKRTGELIPLCHWLSHDTCILENICCDGKGRCKCIMKEGTGNE